MLIQFACRCGQALTAPSDFAGLQVLCPVCGQNVDVPRMGILAGRHPAPPARSGGPTYWPWVAGTAALALLIAAVLVFVHPPWSKPAPPPEEDPNEDLLQQQLAELERACEEVRLRQQAEVRQRQELYMNALQRAQKDLAANRFDEAISHFREAQKIQPGDEIQKGLRQAEQGRDRAEVLRRQQADGAEKTHQAQEALQQGRRALRDDDLETAERALGKAAELAPNHAEVMRALGDLQAARKQRDDRALLEKLRAELRAGDQQAVAVSRTLRDLRAEQVKKAAEAEAVRKELDKLRGQLPANVVRSVQEQVKEADRLALFQRLLQSGRTHLVNRDYDWAVRDLAQALALVPDDSSARAAFQEAKQGQDQTNAAVQKALTDGRRAIAGGELEAAEKIYRDAAQKAPRDTRLKLAQQELDGLIEARERRADKMRDVEAGFFRRPGQAVVAAPLFLGPLRFDLNWQELSERTRLWSERVGDVIRAQNERISAAWGQYKVARHAEDERIRAEWGQAKLALGAQDERIRAEWAQAKQAFGAQDERIRAEWGIAKQAFGAQDERIRATWGQAKQALSAEGQRIQAEWALAKLASDAQTERIRAAWGQAKLALGAQDERIRAEWAQARQALGAQDERIRAEWGQAKLALGAQDERIRAEWAQAKLAGAAQDERIRAEWGRAKQAFPAQDERIAAAHGAFKAAVGAQDERVRAEWGQAKLAAGAQDERIRAEWGQAKQAFGAQDERIRAEWSQNKPSADRPADYLTAIVPPGDAKPRPAHAIESPTEKQRRAEEALRLFAEKQQRAQMEQELARLLAEKELRDRQARELQQLLKDKEARDREAREVKQLRDEVEFRRKQSLPGDKD